MSEAAKAVAGRPLIVSVSKGLEPEQLQPLSCVLADLFGAAAAIAVLSGPSFAEEVYRRQPTAVVAAARDEAVARRAQQVFATARSEEHTSELQSHSDLVCRLLLEKKKKKNKKAARDGKASGTILLSSN